MRVLLLLFVFLAATLGTATFTSAAYAAPRIALASSSGAPVVLAPRDGGLAGDFTITNVGDAPLVVSRIAIRGDADDVRSPPHVTVRFIGGAPTSATIEPGEQRVATIRFMPDRSPRLTQAFGHVIVTSTDEAAGEVAIGFHGEIASPLGVVGAHALSIAIVVPFLGAVFALALGDGRRARVVAVAVGVGECALVAWMLHRFAPGVTTADGNDGLQLIEHAVWIRPLGVEWFVGLDGANVAVVALVALVGLSGAVASPPSRSPAYHATYLVLLGALLGIALALDLYVVFAFVEIVIAAGFVLVDRWGKGRDAGVASTKLAMFGWIGSALLLFGIVALVAHGDRTFLVDGTTVRHSSSIPDLGRVAFASKRATVLGMPLVKVAYGALFVAIAMMLPAFPLHVAQVDARGEGPPAATALLAGAFPAVVTTLALRLLVGVLPEGSALGAKRDARGVWCGHDRVRRRVRVGRARSEAGRRVRVDQSDGVRAARARGAVAARARGGDHAGGRRGARDGALRPRRRGARREAGTARGGRARRSDGDRRGRARRLRRLRRAAHGHVLGGAARDPRNVPELPHPGCRRGAVARRPRGLRARPLPPPLPAPGGGRAARRRLERA